jgi:predicted nucleic acid-binding protein
MSKFLADTSIIVAALVETHPRHEDALSLLDRAFEEESALAISSHCLAEVFASLTAMPTVPRMTPEMVQEVLATGLLARAEIVSLSARDYELAIGHMVRLGLVSGAIYDALHVRAAEKAECDELVTFNGRDFRRMPPAPPTRLVVL